ncbi:hypothetical protein [Winogradskyella forsetii]|uniref:hypothetical protein n=1 Tax=Winogradskyella forsetii TaxID=2686077 RepID=UPI0015C12098|nr:hypothetical protein [Winogradskyella forsetii]
MTWTRKDIANLKLKNNLNENKPKNNVLGNKYTINGKISTEKESINTVLWVLHREGLIEKAVEELEFHPDRKFRFDWALPSLKVAIEYEGLFSKKSGHTTVGGYTKDCEKYNSAQLLGWTVLRYTALNYKNLDRDLKLFIKKNL